MDANITEKPSTCTFSPFSLISQTLRFLIPSFLRRQPCASTSLASSQLSQSQIRDRSKSSALNGLRGVAAFIVMNGHFIYTFTDINDGRLRHYLHLPPCALLVSGHSMVAIFFVISGYVLSIKALRLARTRQWTALNNTLASSVFRRGMRLFLPCMVSMWFIAVGLKLGLFEGTRHFAWELPQRPKNWTETLRLWGESMRVLLIAFRWDMPMVPLDHALWTIGAEFRGSMVVFLMLLGVSRVKNDWVGMAYLCGTMLWAWSADRWELVLFIAGTALALGNLVIDDMREERYDDSEIGLPDRNVVMPFLEPDKPSPKIWRKLHTVSRYLFWAVYLSTCLYLVTYPPAFAAETFGYRTLGRFSLHMYSQDMRFPQSIAAILLVFAATNCPFVQIVFNLPPIQYLGHISYSLYLMHNALLKMISFRLIENIWLIIGPDTAQGWWGYVLPICAGYASLVVSVVIVADVFWRTVDVHSVNFSRKIEKWAFVSD